jgi:hypothetical protein
VHIYLACFGSISTNKLPDLSSNKSSMTLLTCLVSGSSY